jgi:hypothetical protein
VTAAASVPESAFAAFRRGLVEANAVSLALALALGALPYVLLTFVVDEAFVASPRGRVLVTGPRDAGHQLTANLLSVRLDPPEEPQVYVFGASTVRNAVDVARLETELRAAAGRPVRVLGMASGLQRPLEALAMVEALPAEASGVVVVGVGAPSLSYDSGHLRSLVAEPRTGFRYERIEQEARAAGVATPPRSRWYVWDNRRYFLPRLTSALHHAVVGAPVWVPMPQHGRRPPSDETLQKLFGLAARRFEVNEEARRESLDVLGKLADAFRVRPRLRLVLLEDTIHPAHRGRPEYARAVDGLRRIVAPFARERGIPFLQLQERAGITADDFADVVHLRSADAAARFTHELAAEVAPLLREAGGR